MPVFHVTSHRANPTERGARALERLCEQVDGFRARSWVGEDFEAVERELHAQFIAAEREVLGELLEGLDIDAPAVEIDQRRYHRVLDSTESYTTAVGPVSVRRTLYRCGRERAVVPMEWGSAGSPTSLPSLMSSTPKGSSRSMQEPIIALYRSSKICSGNGIPGNSTTLFRGNNGSS